MKINGDISRANDLFKQKKYVESARLFESIAGEFQELSEVCKSAEMKNNASVAYLMSGDFQKSFNLSKDTHLIFEETEDWKNYGLAMGNQASALENLGKKDLALDYYQIAADKLKLAGENESRAYVLKRISALQIQKGDQLDALGSMTAALHNLPKLSRREKILKKLTDLVMKIGNR
ncbi:MAG: tetratricopeptide repeat protein [Anaerolineaceae bacterium]|nr:tetratricopeptide repeat protein [Anaerolineaceae bacterium]